MIDLPSDIAAYLETVEHPVRKADSLRLIEIMREASGHAPYLSGKIIGFGKYHYTYDSGHSGTSIATGFAP